ncbi:MAG: 4-(cytidine 5'-diphospho)-2-C-methyl-D-erythritol kinase [Desulfobacteraceae bacterium]|nr:MAG: 4-(cytidine 5'-diphospho)-2-C-methyl-D-erythritol kinase [Desulfobacteraceae bacterium]
MKDTCVSGNAGDVLLRLRTPAKVNMGLKVTGIRPDGYHELVTVMVPVALYDRLMFKASDGEISMTADGYFVPLGMDNLVLRAAEAFFSSTGIARGVSIHLEKGIPVAAGLGGGSSDAAATLMALNRIFGNPLDGSALREIALKLGADVPFFLLGRPALAKGVGELLEPIYDWPLLWYVIVVPPFQVSTAWVYQNLKFSLTSGNLDSNITAFNATPFEVAGFFTNDLEAVTAARFPVITRIKELLEDAGAEGALMSGSGPSVYGVFRTETKALEAQAGLMSMKLGQVFAVPVENKVDGESEATGGWGVVKR